MGSRRGRYAALAAGAALAACSSAAPPGFSGGGGDHWTIPLVGPLEDGLLVVPAYVHGKGPYLLAIDPDAKVSVVDQEVVKEAGLRTSSQGLRMLDESDAQARKVFAEVLDWKIGTLEVHRTINAAALVVGDHAYDSDGRRIHGLLGRDVIAESLVLGIDREQGVVTLATKSGFKPPQVAAVTDWYKLTSKVENADVPPLPRLLVKTTIAGIELAMHLDLGATASQLRESRWQLTKVAPRDATLVLVDEAGTPRQISRTAVGDDVAAVGVTQSHVLFVPYDDKRWDAQDIDGTLGLRFFAPYKLWADWDESRLYLMPRYESEKDFAARIGRWQSPALASCEHPGCAQVAVTDPLATKAPGDRPAVHPGVVVSVARDKSTAKMDLEVLVSVTSSDRKSTLDWLVASLPAGVDRVITHLPADYAEAALTVADVSPFPRACPTEAGCIDRLAPPIAVDRRMKMIAGEKFISPADETKTVIQQHGGGPVTGVAKVCFDSVGAVETVTMLKPTGYADYDAKIIATIKKTWRYEPYVIHGNAVYACDAPTVFIYQQH